MTRQNEQNLKKTPLYERHLAHGGKMVPFAGYSLPVSFTKIIDEHMQVRQRAGIFDVSHMARIHITGPQALDFAQYLTVNNVRKLKDLRAQYSVICTPDGKALDDLTVYRFSDSHFLFIVNGSRRQVIWNWLQTQLQQWPDKAAIKIADTTDDQALMALQGPLAQKVLQPHTDIVLDQLKFFGFASGSLFGRPVVVSKSGYTGEAGFEIECAAKDGQDVWAMLFEHSDAADLLPIGLGARDTLRLEMGYMLYGNDLDENTTPLEAGLSWVVKLDNDDFIGKESLVKQSNGRVSKQLVGICSSKQAIPRRDYQLFSVNDSEQAVGMVTSGSLSPVLDAGIGLAYVEPSYDQEKLKMRLRGRLVEVDIVKPPFVNIKR